MRLVPNQAGASLRRTVPLLLLLSLVFGCAPDRSQRIERTTPTQLAGLINQRGGLPYVSRAYSSGGTPEDSSNVTGLVIMREAADMRSIGGRYFDDGFGNLIGFGFFKAPKFGGLSRYALTFRKKGGGCSSRLIFGTT